MKKNVVSQLGISILLTITIAFAIPPATLGSYTQAEATSLGTITVRVPTHTSNDGYAVGVVLSKACLASIKCVPSETIAKLDNSTQEYSGKIIEKNGVMVRDCTKVKNSMGAYQYESKFRVFYDPCKDAKINRITIETQIPEYHYISQLKVTENRTGLSKDFQADYSNREYNQYRWVDSKCQNASISAGNWTVLLPDTINYLKNGCDPKSTKIQTLFSVTNPIIKHDVSTSAKYKLDQFYKDVEKNCSKSYGTCKIVNKQVTTRSDTR